MELVEKARFYPKLKRKNRPKGTDGYPYVPLLDIADSAVTQLGRLLESQEHQSLFDESERDRLTGFRKLVADNTSFLLNQ
jgi:hypothetical protein